MPSAGFALGLIPPYVVQAALVASSSTLKVLIEPSFLVSVFAGTVVVCLLAAGLSFRKVATIDISPKKIKVYGIKYGTK